MSYGVVQGTGVVAAAGGAIVAGTATANGAVSFANSNGVTFGVSGNTVTATVNPGPAAGIGGIIAGTQTLTSQSLNFVNSNGISFGLSNSTNLTASYNSTSGAGVGTTFAGVNISGSMTLNTAGLNLSLSGLSGGTGGGGTGPVNISVVGQTSASVNTLNFNGQNGVSFSFNTNNFNLYAQAPPMSIIGNTSGTPALMNTGTFVFAGGPNITLSQVLNSVTISGATVAGAPVNFSAGASSGNLGSVVFSNANGVSFGLSGSTITASAAGGTGGGANTATGYAAGNSTQNSSGTWPISSMVVSGDGMISAGFTGNTLVISGPATAAFTQFSGGMSTGGNTAGSTGMATAQLMLVGGSNITLSGSSSLGSVTISIIGGAGGTGGGATSSLVGTSGLSISSAGATISVQPFPISRSIWPEGNITPVTAPSNALVSLQYWPCANLISASRLDALMSISMGSSATNNTAALAISAYGAIYTRNANTLSTMASGSMQATYSYASNTAGATYLQAPAMRPISVPLNIVATPGEYYVAFNLITATSSIGTATTSFAPAISLMGGNAIQTAVPYAEFGSATQSTLGLYSGMGVFTGVTTGMPATIALSNVVQTGSSLSAANYAFALRNV